METIKREGILNKGLLAAIGSLGHMDTVVICDAGLPIPDEKQRIDLALVPGVPGLLQVLDAVVNEVVVEGVIMARESPEVSPEMFKSIQSRLSNFEIQFVPHSIFKDKSRSSKVIIRTGEYTPYSNVMLICGCAY